MRSSVDRFADVRSFARSSAVRPDVIARDRDRDRDRAVPPVYYTARAESVVAAERARGGLPAAKMASALVRIASPASSPSKTARKTKAIRGRDDDDDDGALTLPMTALYDENDPYASPPVKSVGRAPGKPMTEAKVQTLTVYLVRPRAAAAEVRLLPIRPRSRGARRSLRTFPVVTLHPRFPFNV
jgi:hypothetical protein